MKAFLRALFCVVFAFALATQAYAAADSSWKKDPKDWNVEIYPVYVWAPFMGASVKLPQFPNLPSLPDLPNGPAGPSADASSGISGAAFVGVRVEKSKWSVRAAALWAGMTASTDRPKVKIGMDLIFGQGMLGREILPNLVLQGGVRRMALNISAAVLDYPEVSRKPGVWDPLIGLEYRKPLGKKWLLDLHGDGGGFGVGSDVTYSVQGQMACRFAKHFGVTMGYGLLHFKVSDTRLQRNLVLDQTMHGPILGFGIYF